ncbi:hypothetical protein HDV64DRAFT_263812, partial [Trichoderma sp. TUCIM 5745]
NNEECRPDQVSEDIFLKYIDKASSAVSLFDYEIRSTQHQATKERVFALVNTTSDSGNLPEADAAMVDASVPGPKLSWPQSTVQKSCDL